MDKNRRQYISLWNDPLIIFCSEGNEPGVSSDGVYSVCDESVGEQVFWTWNLFLLNELDAVADSS